MNIFKRTRTKEHASNGHDHECADQEEKMRKVSELNQREEELERRLQALESIVPVLRRGRDT